jgi:hypothetical protein
MKPLRGKILQENLSDAAQNTSMTFIAAKSFQRGCIKWASMTFLLMHPSIGPESGFTPTGLSPTGIIPYGYYPLRGGCKKRKVIGFLCTDQNIIFSQPPLPTPPPNPPSLNPPSFSFSGRGGWEGGYCWRYRGAFLLLQ